MNRKMLLSDDFIERLDLVERLLAVAGDVMNVSVELHVLALVMYCMLLLPVSLQLAL